MAEKVQTTDEELKQQQATGEEQQQPQDKETAAPEADNNANDNTDGNANNTDGNASDHTGDTTDDAQQEQQEQQDPLEKALAEIEELKKQALYKQAEFDNYRKHTMKEKAELILNGGERTIKEFLPVLDDFERAMQSAEKTDDVAALREGMQLIFKKFQDTLAKQGVKAIDTKDADFNTDFHEAVAMVPGMGDDKKNKVIDCVQTGYTLNDKVIRYAKVAVGA